MEKSKVYFTDFRTRLGEGLPTKLKRLMKQAGIEKIDMQGKFVAIKMHFGELGNLGFLRPNYAKAVADELYVTQATAKTHLRNIYAKLDVHTQKDLVELVDRERRSLLEQLPSWYVKR